MDEKPLWGIGYSPILPGDQCRNPIEIVEDLHRLEAWTGRIRLYGANGGQYPIILDELMRTGSKMQLYLGVWFDQSEEVYEASLHELLGVVEHPYFREAVAAVTIGNEAMSGLGVSEEVLIRRIDDARGRLGEAGAGVLITTAEVPDRWSPALVAAVDFLMPNVYAFFGGGHIDGALDSLNGQLLELTMRAKGKQIIFGETGWPTEGKALGQAVPSLDNMHAFIRHLRRGGRSLQYFYFEAYDELWKPTGEFDVERHWGLFTADRQPKEGVLQVLQER